MEHLKRTFILLALAGAALVACNNNPPPSPDPPPPPPPESDVLKTLRDTEWVTVKFYSDPITTDDFVPFDSITIVFYGDPNTDIDRCRANHHTEIYDNTSSEGGMAYVLPPIVEIVSYNYDYSYDSISQGGTIINLGDYVLAKDNKSLTITYTDNSTAVYNRVK
jgi:hypothetical protein